ncbi:ferric reductase-like transmembrane domain-containing protein, partial [Conexibacter stalactiti]
MIALAATSPLWLATRGAGIVALLLLTVTLVLGVADVKRWRAPGWPRFVVDAIHRGASLLSILFVALHVATTVLDGYVAIGWLDALIPFASPYETFWVGLGTVAFDILLLLGLSGLLRQRVGHRTWRAIHWSAYGCWPIALVHALGTGSDAATPWMLAVAALCALAVAGAVALRVGGVGGAGGGRAGIGHGAGA